MHSVQEDPTVVLILQSLHPLLAVEIVQDSHPLQAHQPQ